MERSRDLPWWVLPEEETDKINKMDKMKDRASCDQ
jgi:hypothetical protein